MASLVPTALSPNYIFSNPQLEIDFQGDELSKQTSSSGIDLQQETVNGEQVSYSIQSSNQHYSLIHTKDTEASVEGRNSGHLSLDFGYNQFVNADLPISTDGASQSPVAQNDTFTTDEETQLIGDVSINDSDPDNSTGGDAITNGGFETGSLGPWTGDAFSFIGTSFYAYEGTYGLGLFSNGYAEQSVLVNVDAILELSFYMRSANNNNVSLTVGYTDGNTSIFVYPDTGSTWVKRTINLGQLESGKTINSIRIQRINGGAINTGIDNVVVEIVDELTYSLVDDVSNGTLVFNSDGSFSYTPDLDFFGNDSFTYNVYDGFSNDTAAVTLTVDNVNDAPVAVDDVFSADEESQIIGDLSLNDTDLDNSPSEFIYSVVSGVSSGTLFLDNNGTFSYTSDTDFYGTDSFVYELSDGNLTDTATVTFTIININDAPVAVDDAFTTDEETSFSDTVSSNDGDVDSLSEDTSAISNGGFESGTMSPWTGSGTVNALNAYEGTYKASMTGSAYIEQTVSVSAGLVKELSFYMYSYNDNYVTLIVYYADGSSSSFPFAESGNAWVQRTIDPSLLDSGKEIVRIRIQHTQVIMGITWLDKVAVTLARELSYSLFSDATSGSLSFYENGTFTYTPNFNFFGTDSFMYELTDGSLNDTATVTLTITNINDGPIAVDDQYIGDEDIPISGDLRTNDSDIDNLPVDLSYTIITNVNSGILVLYINGTFTYTPNTDFFGTDSFVYEVSDGDLTASATVTLTILPVNDSPQAEDDTFAGNEDTMLIGDVSVNDVDVDNSTLELTYTITMNATSGTLSFSSDGSFTYIPNQNFYGTDTFSYEVSDGLLSNSANVTLTVVATNDAPVGIDDNFTGDEDVMLVGDVGTNDYDIDNSTTELGFSIFIDVNSGSLTLYSNGTFSYLPNTNFFGTDSFTYQVTDGNSTINVMVTLTLNPVNDAPVAQNDGYAGNEDTQLLGDVSANDADVDNSTIELSYTIVSTVTSGLLVFYNNGSFIYTPNNNFYGTDMFSYEISDGSLIHNATVTLNVISVNDDPVAQDDNFTGDEDTSLIGDVSANDNDVDNSTLQLSFSVLADVNSGTLILNTDGSFTYTPDADFFGTDSFTYLISDGLNNDSASVTLTINNINDPPVPQDDNFFGSEDTPLLGDVSSNDGDVDNSTVELTYTVLIDVTSGTLVLNTNGSFTYTPDLSYFGTDTFTYRVSDGISSDSATVSILISNVNNAPNSQDDSFNGEEDTLLLGDVSTNDSDIDNSTLELSYTIITNVSSGTLVLNIDGSFSYTPDNDFYGTDSFTYQVTDGSLSDSATVTITISAINDVPFAQNDSNSGNEDNIISGDVSVNDGDTDNSTIELSFSVVTDVNYGTLVLNSDGSFTYTPDTDFFGTDSFTYQIYDGYLTDTASVTLTIIAINDAPIANDDSYASDEDNQLNDDVSSNDSDIDNNSIDLTYSLFTDVSSGTLIFNNDGTFTYTPDTDFYGTDTFTYEISDGELINIAIVVISISPVNDAPVSQNDNFTVGEDTILSGDVSGNDYDIDNSTSEMEYVLLTEVSSGSLVFYTDGSFTYTPTENFVGADSFTYEVSDGTLSSTAIVNLIITNVNDVPIAENDSFIGDEDTIIAGNVSPNDSDIDNSTIELSYSVITDVVSGTLFLNSDGSFTYTPYTDFYGTDSFVYELSDGISTDTAIVNITITGINDTPVAQDDSVTSDEDIAILIDVLDNDYDIDGDSLTLSILQEPTLGSVEINPDNTITFTPDPNVHGQDTFTYQISDGNDVSTATVIIDITAINDKPTGEEDNYTAISGQNLVIAIEDGLLANDNDIDGDIISIESYSTPLNGELTLASDGSFTYRPTTGFVGTDSFSYSVTDGQTTSDPITVTIVVQEDPSSSTITTTSISSTTDVSTTSGDTTKDQNNEETGGFLAISPIGIIIALFMTSFVTQLIKKRSSIKV